MGVGSGKTVLIDGKNVSLSEGTGIATYTRNVAGCYGDLGYARHLLFGENVTIKRSDPASLREVLFYDATRPMRRYQRYLTSAQTLNFSSMRHRPVRIDGLGAVENDAFKDRIPAAEGIWNFTNLFRRAVRTFHLTRRFTRVRNDMMADVAHWTYAVPIEAEGAANVYTLHDIVPLKLPFTTLDEKRAYYAIFERIVERADLLLTVSETSRRDICEFFPQADSKLAVTYQSVEVPRYVLELGEEEIARDIRAQYGLEYGDYILFVGAIEPKKNVERLVSAYMRADVDVPLVIAGKAAWLASRDIQAIEAAQAHAARQSDGERAVYQLGYVPSDLVYKLVRGARCLAFPSIYEGFGLPIVEAMACGTPVLTSDRGAPREIAGESAAFVDPYDIDAIRRGLERVSGSKPFRLELSELGVERAATFGRARMRARLAEALSAL